MAHRGYYTKDGTRVPSVTTIIRRNLGWGAEGLLGFYRGTALRGRDPEEIRDQAAAFGTYVHRCIEMDQEWVPIDDESKPYLAMANIEQGHIAYQLYKQWADRHDLVRKGVELPLVSEKYGFGGTIDMPAEVDGKLMLLDFKTTKAIRITHWIQLSAYHQLYLECKGKKLEPAILHVSWDRKPFLHKRGRSLAKEWRVFKHLLALEKLRVELEA